MDHEIYIEGYELNVDDKTVHCNAAISFCKSEYDEDLVFLHSYSNEFTIDDNVFDWVAGDEALYGQIREQFKNQNSAVYRLCLAQHEKDMDY